MAKGWTLPDFMDEIETPPECLLSYSEVQRLLDDPDIEKVFDQCMSIIRDHLVAAALIRSRGDRQSAAARLGITRSALRDYMRNKGRVSRRRLK